MRRQFVEVGRVGVVPAHVTLVDRLGIVLEGAVDATPRPEGFQLRRQLDGLGDLLAVHALVEHAYRLVVDVLVDGALLPQVVVDLRLAPQRPVVALELHLGLVAEQVDGFAEVLRPLQRIAHLGPAQGVEVVHVVGGVLGHPHGLGVREIGVHFHRCLGARGHLEHHLHPVQGQFLAGFLDLVGGLDQGGAAGGHGNPHPGVDAALRVARQQGAEHVYRTAGHGIAGDHVLADGEFGEILGRDDAHLAGLDVSLVDYAAHAAEVVDVRVAVDHGHHRFLAQVLAHQLIGRLGGFLA
ncbi:hypothetical protein D9M71_388810 [compost metagenome]